MAEKELNFKIAAEPLGECFAVLPTPAAPSFTFSEGGEESGCLFIGEDGRFRFEGDVDASAKIFFEHLIKQYIDPYISKNS